MNEIINVASQFEPIDNFIPTKHILEIHEILFDVKIALCELIIVGVLAEIQHNRLKFTSVLPEIETVYIRVEGEDWVQVNFERVLNEFENIKVDFERNRLLSEAVLIKNILNEEDSMGGTNLFVYLPPTFSKKSCKNKMSIKFVFSFEYRSNREASNFDEYYLETFSTPSDVSFPSAGYKPCSWLPCLNRSTYSTPWDIYVSVPTELIVICSGTLCNVRNSFNSKEKIWQFTVDYPSTPGNISIIVAPFSSYDHQYISAFTTPGRAHLLEHTVKCFTTFFEFFENTYNFTLPFSCINIVFMSQTKKCKVLSNIIIFPVIYLAPRENIVRRYKNQKLFCRAVCELIFGSIVQPCTIADIWLVAALHQYTFYNLFKSVFGLCEFKKFYENEQNIASSLPNSRENITFYLCPHVYTSGVLSDSNQKVQPFSALMSWYTSSHPRLLSKNNIWNCFMARCGVTLYYMETPITYRHISQIITKIISVAPTEPFSFNRPSTEFFFSSVLILSGKDIYLQTCRNWFSVTRPLLLSIEYLYNRRKSCIDVIITNEDYEAEINIPVNISLTVQELDGSFEHNQQINRNVRRSNFEIPTHSTRSRRSNLKRRVLTENGREVDIELQRSTNNGKTIDGIVSIDNPVLWIRVNLDHSSFFGEVVIIQPDSSWYYQASLDSHPMNHLKAVRTLGSFPSEETILLLSRLIKNKTCWYAIRAAAFESLVQIFNVLSNDDMMKLERDVNPIELYRTLFCLPNYTELPQINDFSNLPLYLFQLLAIKSIARLKLVILKDLSKSRFFLSYELLRTLYEYNDNASNLYLDCCYRATILRAIGESIEHLKPDFLNDACSFVLVESLTAMKIDEINNYSHGCVPLASIVNLLKLQKLEFIPINSKPFLHCCLPGIEMNLRKNSFEIICQFIKHNQAINEYKFLLDIIENDPSYIIKLYCIKALIKFPPFQSKDFDSLTSQLNVEEFQQDSIRIAGKILNESLSLFHEFSGYYHILYGEGHSFVNNNQEDTESANVIPTIGEGGLVRFIVNT